MLKHELDKLRKQHDEKFEHFTHHQVNYPLRRSSESVVSGKYFTTNTEYKSRDPQLRHYDGVLKRTENMNSTPSFKPEQQFNFKPEKQFHYNQQSPAENEMKQDDTIGNKFDELEKRLISLENTLDSKPEGQNENYNTLKSYNPFSPDRNERVYIADQEQQMTSIDPYNTIDKTESYQNTNTKNNSNEYIETSNEQIEHNENQDFMEKETIHHQPGIQNMISKIKQLENQLEANSLKLNNYEDELVSKNQQIYELKAQTVSGDDVLEDLKQKLENEQKLNERLTIAYDVLREDKVKDYLKSKEDSETVQIEVEEYK